MLKFLKQHKYLFLLLYIPVYLLWFSVLEHVITTDYWVSYLPLDDRIPFLPGFVYAYGAWYLFLLIPGLYMLFRDTVAFQRYLWFFIIGFTICLLVCTVFPNGQNLRPQNLTGDSLSLRLILELYRTDTNTNVFPSMHIVGTVAVFYGVYHSKTLRHPRWMIPIAVLALLICASTVLIKQHSILDLFAGVALCVPLWLILDRIGRKRDRQQSAT